jgi:hypothetical protein
MVFLNHLIAGLMLIKLMKNNMDRYVYIRDDESNLYFTENKPYHFKVQLKFPLKFDGFWKVALCEIHFNRDTKIRKINVDDTVFIYSNICKESIVRGGEYSVLRKVSSKSKTEWSNIFDTPFYLPLTKNEFQELEFVIKTTDGELASFINSPVHITLHFKRYPFYSSYESI